MQVSLALFAIGWLGCICATAGVNDSGPLHADDIEAYARYFAGTYRVIGRLPGGGLAYCGKVVIAAHGKEFKVTRTVNGKTTAGRAFVDLDANKNRIFVMQFAQGGKQYEATYLQMSNYDSHPRLTGHVVTSIRPQSSAVDDGLEALFPTDDPPSATPEE